MSRKHRPRKLFKLKKQEGSGVGAPPGLLITDPLSPAPVIRAIAYKGDELFEGDITDLGQIPELLKKYDMTWIDVRGLGDAEIIQNIGEIFCLHKLALEDVLSKYQRPKVEDYENYIFCIVRSTHKVNIIGTEQLNVFFSSKFVVTFLDSGGEELEPVRERIRTKSGKIRQLGADFIAYSIVDAAIDSFYPVFEDLGEDLEDIETEIIEHPGPRNISHLHNVKRELLEFRRAVWPLKEALNRLLRSEVPIVSSYTTVYLRDSIDHTIQLIDLIEYYREVCSDLMGVYLSSISNRTNEVMKVLTIIATIFIPLTFLAGVYGMNFNTDAGRWSMPELNSPIGYPVFWSICIMIGVGLLLTFKKFGWMGGFGKLK
ncbi:MAG: magnesium/cobalt transporter CorA [bacterium]|nr:magnesium/cobalt transporter CorA [bacterium]